MPTVLYCTIKDLRTVYADIDSLDRKTELPAYDFATESGSVYRLDNSGHIYKLYRDGKDLGNATGSLNEITGSDVWFYSSGSDTLFVDLANDVTGSRMETSAMDWVAAQSQSIERGSEMLESVLDNRFPRPLPQTTRSKSGGKYDYYIVKPTAIFSVIELLQASEPKNPLVDFYTGMLYNEEKTGIIDKINGGHIKLSFETTPSDRIGEIQEGTIDAATTGYPTTPIGNCSVAYDDVTMTVDAGGTLTAGVKNNAIKYSVKDMEGNTIVSSTLMDKGFQAVGHNVKVRWESNKVYTANDTWTLTMVGVATTAPTIGVIRMHKK